MRTWVGRHRVATVIVLGGVTAAASAVLIISFPDLARAQVAKTAAELGRYDKHELCLAAYIDLALMAAYAVFGWALFSLIRDPRDPSKTHPGATAGSVLVVGAAGADLVENGFLLAALEGGNVVSWLSAMRAAGLVRYGLLGAAALTFLALVVLRSWRAPLPLGHSTDVPPQMPEKDWLPPREECGKHCGKKCVKGCKRKGAKPVVGVCVSGGGIRSAAFSLGALQALREKGRLDNADYLAAVSGGGYLAAGWALSQTEPVPGPGERAHWAQGSPEERWFRDNSSYLIPDTKGGIAGVARLLAGLLVNFLLLGILLAAVSRPVGWAMHGIHKELRAGAPIVLARDATADMVVGPPTLLGTVETGAAAPRITRYHVGLLPNGADNNACFYQPHRAERTPLCVGATQNEGKLGIVEVQAGRAKVVKQPQVLVTPGATILDGKAEIDQQPEIAVVDDLVTDGVVPGPGQFKVSRQPLVGVDTGLDSTDYPTYEGWMWALVGGLLGGAALVSLGITAFRPRGRKAEVGRAVARALGGAGLVAFLVIVALPWLVVWLPRTLGSLAEKSAESETGSALYDYLLPGGGLLALTITAARHFLSMTKSKDDASDPSLFKKAWDKVSKHKKELKWYELSLTKIGVALVSLVAVIVLFVNSLQFAAANGPFGRLMGLGFVRDVLPWWAFWRDWQELVAMVVGLFLFALVADAHSWSLFPFYKERLSHAFLLQRTGDCATPRDYFDLVPMTRLAGARGPQLVACCAVNLSETGVVPPARRAASFTFSSTEIGGPIVGYAKPDDYNLLPAGRQRDVTLASAMAISGAAFSPAMGKTNLGPIGTLLALANLRLGVWIPHPQRACVHEKAAREWDWRRLRRPHWVWFLRELTNKYAFNRRYLYVTDGGHWDNLGLVELLRRGCTEIYCISAAGDGPNSFGTIGEAIALAREELGVEITLDPSPLRAPTKAPEPAPPRELRRSDAKDKAAPYAAASAVKGTFRFTRDATAMKGVIYYAEADLTADMPFDVHTFAESELDFPDDPTGDQVFNHRQFESYRALGHHQAVAAAALSEPPDDPTCLEKVKKALCD